MRLIHNTARAGRAGRAHIHQHLSVDIPNSSEKQGPGRVLSLESQRGNEIEEMS